MDNWEKEFDRRFTSREVKTCFDTIENPLEIKAFIRQLLSTRSRDSQPKGEWYLEYNCSNPNASHKDGPCPSCQEKPRVIYSEAPAVKRLTREEIHEFFMAVPMEKLHLGERLELENYYWKYTDAIAKAQGAHHGE